MIRTLLTGFVLAYLFATCTASAQDSVWDALKQAGETYNEQEGIDDTQGASELTPEQEEWQKEWNEKLENFNEVLSDLDDKDLSCVGLMVLYVYDYIQLIERTDEETDCRVKHDLYGLQAVSMASSTTIMYCPEGLSGYNNEKLREIEKEYMTLVLAHVPDAGFFKAIEEGLYLSWHDLTAWQWLAARTKLLLNPHFQQAREDYVSAGGEYEDYTFIHYLISFFTPKYIVPRSLSVNKSMAAIVDNCPGL